MWLQDSVLAVHDIEAALMCSIPQWKDQKLFSALQVSNRAGRQD